MCHMSITPSITVTIGRHTRLYYAYVTTGSAQLDSPSTITLHAAAFCEVAGLFAADPITCAESLGRTPARLILVDATERDPLIPEPFVQAPDDWAAMSAWASDLAVGIAADQATQHVAIFVLDDRGDDLRLAAQVWGAGEDTGAVIVGDWTVPLDGSVCGRVYRTVVDRLHTDRDTGEVFVTSAWGKGSDWYRNLQAAPRASHSLRSSQAPGRCGSRGARCRRIRGRREALQ